MKLLYKYRLKTIFRDYSNIFWTLVFPILLATLFYFSFGQLLTNVEQMEAVPVAVVESEEAESYFGDVLEELADADEPLLKVSYMDQEEAQQQLEQKQVDGIYYLGEEPKLTVRTDGVYPSILRNVLDSYLQVQATVQRVAQKDPTQLQQVIEKLAEPEQVLRESSVMQGNFDFMRENFYALIAMTCLYGSFFGLTGAMATQANLSPLGARRSISPTRKLAAVGSDVLAAVTVMYAIVLILFAYIRFVLGVDLGDNWPAILLACLLGVFTGVMFGMFVGVVVRGPRGAKEGILIGGTLVLCFFSGLMYSNMRFIIERSAPVFNRINPAALLVDSLYALDAYGVGERYWMNIGLLALVGIVLCVASVTVLRRKQYASV